VRGRDRVVSLHDYVSDRDGDVDVGRIEMMTSRHPDPEHLTGNGELRRMLEDAIEALPDDFRAVFVLRAVEGMSVAETAEALSIPPETVKTRFHRAPHRLQETLGARFDALMPVAFEFGGARCDRIVAAVLARLGPALEAARRTVRVAARWPERQSNPD
jgi:RNA polymerase sigma-70 factor (ECF subfamily)